ncbi:hypothetical protein FA95DRAFT_1500744, partial [Auriscalpium vulgare]
MPFIVTEADPPFNDVRADIILRSSDNVHFRVSRFILSIASPVFADMFNLGKPLEAIDGHSSEENHDGLPVVPLVEDSRTLNLLLRWCYPVKPPKLTTLEDARRMVSITQKYAVDAFDDVIDEALRAHIVSDPVAIVAVAVTHHLDDMTKAAFQGSLTTHLTAIISSGVTNLSGNALNALVRYHTACGAAAAAVTLQRDFFPSCQ